MNLKKDRWLGNQWASIDITPVDDQYFLLILQALAEAYEIDMPEVIDTIDGYAADFVIDDVEGTFRIDAWTFSLAFADDALRDEVFNWLLRLKL